MAITLKITAMKSQEKSPIQEFTMFDSLMSDIYYPGWDEIMEDDHINWHWRNFWSIEDSPEDYNH